MKGMRLIKDEDKVWLDVMIGPRATVGEVYPLKMKVDGGEVIQVVGMAVTDRLIRLAIDDDVMDKIKKGNKLAIVATNQDGGTVNLITSLTGFTDAYNRVK
ncbi:MAG: invasion associated locus B family protein [Leptotrichiaceae bacterium]|nr:invasion associated locus B family protein [Leptotrichiaceae bacterium]